MSSAPPPSAAPPAYDERTAWRALWALLVGFFMILVDATIVVVSMPAIMRGLHTDINGVVWVTSAYLLAYAVPLLITGRLGDRFGPKRIYQLGLLVFTLASLWCGLTGSIAGLITARVVQGLGAALVAPQTMAIITQVFPPQRRGGAMGVWGATAGVASLVGPIAGGLLTDSLGWEWIFFVNVPVGILGLLMAQQLVPNIPGRRSKFDVVGVLLSAVALFLIVFGIEEGQKYDWNSTIWLMIGAGLVLLAVFVAWQHRVQDRALMPLTLFRDRNFSVSSAAITTIGFAIVAFNIPLMLWAQSVRGMSPTKASLLLAPMAIVTAALAPVVGRFVDKVHPRTVAAAGIAMFALGLFWIGAVLDSTTSFWTLLAPICLLGVANACMWSPLAVSATHTLPGPMAGAGAGVYNTVRQVGSVMGSAGVAVLMESRLSAMLPASGAAPANPQASGQTLPASIAHEFARAMGQSVWLPAAVLALGFLCALFLHNPSGRSQPSNADEDASAPAARR